MTPHAPQGEITVSFAPLSETLPSEPPLTELEPMQADPVSRWEMSEAAEEAKDRAHLAQMRFHHRNLEHGHLLLGLLGTISFRGQRACLLA